MADEQFTEEDVESVKRIIHEGAVFRWAPGGTARVILRALAEAGRLLPAGAKITEEIGVRVEREHPHRKEKAGTVMTHFHRETALRAPEVWDGWSLVRRDSIKWAGPWVPVGTTEEPQGE